MQTSTTSHGSARDHLTGLMSRQAVADLLAEHLAPDATQDVTVLLVDLDGFGLLNDTAGHSVGDLVLVEVGERLRALPGCRAGRLGSDEFCLVLLGASHFAADSLAAAVLPAVAEPLAVAGRTVTMAASVGVATASPGTAVDTLLQHADLALRGAKTAGRGRARWFGEELHAALERRAHEATLAEDLRGALSTSQLQLYYQTAFGLGTGSVVGVEALLRWNHPVHGMMPPGDVVAMAEATGLIQPLGEWVIRTAMDQAALWRDIDGFTVWVNVSPCQLAQEGLAGLLQAELRRVGLAPHRFGIEVTESALADQDTAAGELRRVEALGVQIAIDDFGTGYSSLARLVRFPVDVIKIDRSFVTELGSGTGDAVVNGIVTLAKGLGAEVIAEGVETAHQLDRLRSTGCDAAAGFLLARPAPVANVVLDGVADPWREGCGRAAPGEVPEVPHQRTADPVEAAPTPA